EGALRSITDWSEQRSGRWHGLTHTLLRRSRLARCVVGVADACPRTCGRRALRRFRSQYDQNVYAERSKVAGVTPESVKVMEDRVTELAPQLARVFFNAETPINHAMVCSKPPSPIRT